MNKPQHYYSKITDGKLNKYVSLALGVCLRAHEGKEVKITIAEHKKQRSRLQNNFYFGFIVPEVKNWLFEQGTNLTLDETHDWIVKRIWKYGEYLSMPDGSMYEKRKSSTQANTKLWADFQDITYCWFAERGLVLPEPEKEIPKHIRRYNDELTELPRGATITGRDA